MESEDKIKRHKVHFVEIAIPINSCNYKPAGTGTVIFLRWTVEPFPSQFWHGCEMCIRDPIHRLQVDLMMNGPVLIVSIPVPLQ